MSRRRGGRHGRGRADAAPAGRGGAAGRPGTAATPPRTAGRPGGAASPPRATGREDDEAEVGRALTLARGLAIASLAVSVLLLLLAALGRGTPYLLGALDFVVLAAAFGWIGWRDPGGRRDA